MHILKNPAELKRTTFNKNKRQRESDDTQIRTSIKGTWGGGCPNISDDCLNNKLANVVLTVWGGVSKHKKKVNKAYLQRTALCIFWNNLSNGQLFTQIKGNVSQATPRCGHPLKEHRGRRSDSKCCPIHGASMIYISEFNSLMPSCIWLFQK